VSRLLPCSRDEFIRKLRALGYKGPFPGSKHQFMVIHKKPPITLPNPHQSDISVGLLAKILRDAGISRDQWLNA
jgi:predicted RNA binding protein YcfA (HicA-like mRNA interferase family)